MLIDNQVTRFQNGVNNRDVADIFASLKTMDPTRFHAYWEDFDYYTAADWVVTLVGAGTAALASVAGNSDGGRLILTNAAVDDNSVFLNKVGEGFLFKLGKRAFFKTVLRVSDALQSDFVTGLQITDTTPLAVTDGIYFLKTDGAATIDLIAMKNSVAVSALAIASAVTAVDIELSFTWDGISRIYYGVNGATIGSITPATSLPDDEELTISFGVQNGEAVAKTMTVDYIFAAMER